MSSMSSLSPLVNQNQNIPKRSIEQYRTSYSKNKNLVNIVYGNKFEEKNLFNENQSAQSSENLILPATHHNINEVSSKTRTIIDEINLLLDSNKKNAPPNQQNQMPRLKYKKMHTQNYDTVDVQYSSNKN